MLAYGRFGQHTVCLSVSRWQYSDAGVAMRPSPIVVVEDDYLVLDYNGQRVMEPFNTMAYHNVKMVDHIPLVRRRPRSSPYSTAPLQR